MRCEFNLMYRTVPSKMDADSKISCGSGAETLDFFLSFKTTGYLLNVIAQLVALTNRYRYC